MRVSVVICTLNRADALAAALECLRHQEHDDFEVIVVNGPSDDRTLEVLEPWRELIHYFDNPERNLSISRNIGLRACSGELVAFMDDDALPEPTWLTDVFSAFDDPEVAAAGGIVWDHTGLQLQYRYTSTNRLLRTSGSDRPHDLHCFPGSFVVPYLQGTNQIFRRDRLLEVGGFDERIFFFGDDCDIAARLIDAGWIVRQLPNSAVHHKFLPSGIRDHQRITTNWFPVVHDHTYFSLRHASGFLGEDQILDSVHEFIESRIADTRMHEQAGRLPPGSAASATATCLRAFAAGFQDGMEYVGRRLPAIEPSDSAFLRFPTIRNENRRRIVIVSSSYTGNITGGVGRILSDLAPALAARGHDVRVVTTATGFAAVDFEDGVWVHRIEVPSLAGRGGVVPDVTDAINSFATAAAVEIHRIRSWSEPDLVLAPLWDLEGIGVLRSTDLPVALHVSTPLAVIGPMAGLLVGSDDDPAELRRILELEAEVLATADLFQANTTAVTDTVRASYGERCEGDRWRVLNIGLRDRTVGLAAPTAPADGRRVFFAGRFEARKGIDTLLEAMARIMPDHPDVELILAGEDRPLQPGGPLTGRRFLEEHRGEPWLRRVQMLGPVDDEVLDREYSRAELVVLPSRYESFGLVMAEAMMHGKPVVSTDGSGIREVVRADVDGLLVAPGDARELETAIRTLLDDPALARRLGEHGRRRFEEHLCIDRVAERFEEFLIGVSSTTPTDADGSRLVVPAGATHSVPVEQRTATIIVRALAPSTVRVTAGRDHRFALGSGERRRIRVDDADGGCCHISVEAGELLVERVVTVTHEADR